MGYSQEHLAYPGVITLKFHTLMDVLTQVAVSLYTQGVRKILFLNGHGGNRFIVAAMRRKLASEEGVPSTVGYTWWDLPQVAEELKLVSESDKGNIGHAGEMETSIQLYLQPELVDKDATSWVRGVWGDPATGTREKGERVITRGG